MNTKLSSVHSDLLKVQDLIQQAENLIESAMTDSNPNSYLHDLLLTSQRNLAVVYNKIQVSISITEKNI